MKKVLIYFGSIIILGSLIFVLFLTRRNYNINKDTLEFQKYLRRNYKIKVYKNNNTHFPILLSQDGEQICNINNIKMKIEKDAEIPNIIISIYYFNNLLDIFNNQLKIKKTIKYISNIFKDYFKKSDYYLYIELVRTNPASNYLYDDNKNKFLSNTMVYFKKGIFKKFEFPEQNYLNKKQKHF